MPANGDLSLHGVSQHQFGQDTAYDHHAMRLNDEYESDADTLISRPPAAYTSSPYIFERQPALPGPTEELTPPPSPVRHTASPCKSTASNNSYFGAANVRLGPLLSRAGSVLGTRSGDTSPTRVQQPVQTPTASRTSVVSEQANRKSKGSFADFFQVQGLSAPVNIGLVPSPKRETPPRVGSPHKSTKSESMASVVSTSAPRPSHVRSGSTLQAAATFLGFASPSQRGRTPSPKPRQRVPIDENDAILNLDFEDELFPQNGKGIPKENLLSEILSNGEKVFGRVRTAYRQKCQQLAEEQTGRQEDREELAEERMRAGHLKKQLNDMAIQLTKKDAEISSLHEELEEMDRRARSIRMIGALERGSMHLDLQDRERLFSLGDDDASSESEAESGSGSVFERPSSRSTAPTEADAPQSHGDRQANDEQRQSMPWRDAAPFLPPEAKLVDENRELRKRIAQLEEIVNGCLGLVDDL